jgi:hypothetical protein
MWTDIQNNASNLHEEMALGITSMKKDGTVLLRLSWDNYNGVRKVLERVMLGELTESPARIVSYVQPSMIADDAGTPLFSMKENA